MDLEKLQFEWIEEYLEMFDNSSIQKSSFDFFIHHRLSKIVEEEPALEAELDDGSIYCVKFGQLYVDKPYIIDENRNVRFIYPHEARTRELTYSSAVSINIRVSRYLKDTNEEVDIKEHFKVMIARIPMMIGTSKCNLFGKTTEQRHELGECLYDRGGYFIIRGKERVLVSQERMNHNTVYVFEQKAGGKFNLVSEIRSMSDETGHSVLVQMKICHNPDHKIVLQIPYITQEIPVGYIFRAFGFTEKKMEEMMDFHLSFSNHPYLVKVRNAVKRDYNIIENSENAISYIAQFSVHNIVRDKKNNYIRQILHNELFPHLGIHSPPLQKGMFLAHMLQKLVMTYIGTRNQDDRDHINNKRLETSGVLIAELFRTLFKRWVRAIEPQLSKRPDIMVVISRLNIITQGIKHCFSTGNWGIPKSSYIRSGVSQILSRLTYNAFLSHLRRILIPIGKEGKNTKIRQIHPSQIGFICAHETPEGHCLTPDTPILASDGINTIPMGDLSLSSDIMAVDKNNGNYEPSKIYNYFSVKPRKLFYIELYNGQSIRASGKHPFLVWSDTSRWVHAEDLLITDRVGYMLSRRPIQSILSKTKEELFGFDVLLEGIKQYRANPSMMYIHELIALKDLKYHDPDFLTTKWSRLPIFMRLLGLFSTFPRTDPCFIDVPEYIDITTVIHDMKLCFPRLYNVNDRRLHGCCFSIIFSHTEISDTILNNECPSCFREFLSGYLSGINYRHVVVNLGKKLVRNNNGMYIPNASPFHLRIMRWIQNRFNSSKKQRWDLIYNKEDDFIQLIPVHTEVNDSDKADFIEIFGMWYQPVSQRNLLLMAHYLRQTRRTSFLKFYHDHVLDHDNPITFMPIRSLKHCPIETVMDFTTTSDYHAFIANGFVTHNSAGIVKNMALSTQVSTRVDTTFIRSILENMKDIEFDISKLKKDVHNYKIMLNGNWIGSGDGPIVYQRLLDFRDKRLFPHHTSISLNKKEQELWIYGDEGRMLRPLFRKDELLTYLATGVKKSMKELMEDRVVVFMDSYEIEHSVIAMTIEELQKEPSLYNMCEIHPSLITGLCVSLIPYVDHTQAPRVTYHASMGKQAIGYCISTNDVRSDTVSHILWYPEKPLIRTHYGKMSGCDEMATGNNLIVAIAMYTGFNQEDSVLFNQSAIERGLFRSSCFRNITVEERKKSTTHVEIIGPPMPNVQSRSYNYSKLDKDGIIKLGVFVGNGDVLVNRTQIKTTKSSITGITEEKIDNSVVVKSGEEGYIDKVFQSITPDGYKIIKIKIRSLKIPEIGDKVASRSAQKGTIGMVFRQEDMPFTISGITPDLVINPLCIPSRMTINQLIECLGAKSSAFKGRYRFSTAFSSHSTDVVESLCKELQDIGFERHGYETMMNGFTGKSFQSLIFIGPTYYHRLKHLVGSKIHARNHGSVQALTRQPLEGRSRDGGLRFGEMERDSVVGRTPIPLSCGISVKIEDMYENGWEVLGWCPKEDGIVHCRQTEFLEKEELHECVKLFFQDGRTLECTLNHPLLTSDNTWVVAQDLVINETRVKTSVTYPLCDIYEEMKLCQGWSMDLSTIRLSTDTRHEFLRSLAFMRLLGLVITDGHIVQKGFSGSIFLGHEIDIYNCLADIRLVYGTDDVRVHFHDGTYTVSLPKVMVLSLKSMDGIVVCGNKTKQAASLPFFFTNRGNLPPLPLIREFLGGMFGGDGHTCYLGMHRGKRDVLTSISFSRSTTKQYISSLEKYMSDITYLLKCFGLSDISLQKAKETTNSKSKSDLHDQDRTYSLTLHLSVDELIPFSETIGFRYCVHKSVRLEAGVSYKRFRNSVARQHNWLVDRVIEITNYRELKSIDPSKKIQTKKAIDQAVTELLQKEPLYHSYAIPSGHDIADHVMKGTTFGKFRSNMFPNAHEYMKEIDTVSWFIGDSQKISYGVKQCNNCLPTMNLKVIAIQPIGPQKVFDIQVDRTESFLANGVVAHNCMISHGVSRFLTERLFDMSDKFTIPLCSHCGNVPHHNNVCNMCDSVDIRTVPLPYACKLLFQELNAMGIKIRMYPKEETK